MQHGGKKCAAFLDPNPVFEPLGTRGQLGAAGTSGPKSVDAFMGTLVKRETSGGQLAELR